MAEITSTAGNNSISYREQQAVRAHLLVVSYQGQEDPVYEAWSGEMAKQIGIINDVAYDGLGRFLSDGQIRSVHVALDAIVAIVDEADPHRTSSWGEEVRRQLRNVAAIFPEGEASQ